MSGLGKVTAKFFQNCSDRFNEMWYNEPSPCLTIGSENRFKIPLLSLCLSSHIGERHIQTKPAQSWLIPRNVKHGLAFGESKLLRTRWGDDFRGLSERESRGEN